MIYGFSQTIIEAKAGFSWLCIPSAKADGNELSKIVLEIVLCLLMTRENSYEL